MWGSDYPHSESTFPRSREILAEILAGVPDDEQARIAGGTTARVYGFDVARLASGSAPVAGGDGRSVGQTRA
jgi:amidohydrolase family protein